MSRWFVVAALLAVAVAVLVFVTTKEHFEAADIAALAQRVGALRQQYQADDDKDADDKDADDTDADDKDDDTEYLDPEYGAIALGLMKRSPRIFRRLLEQHGSATAFDLAALEDELLPGSCPAAGQMVSAEKASPGSGGASGPARAGPSSHVSTTVPSDTTTSYPFDANAPPTYSAQSWAL